MIKFINKISDRLIYYNTRVNYVRELLRKARRQKNIAALAIDILYHKAIINSAPIDYLRYEFYLKEKSMKEKELYIGKRGSKFFPYDKNEIKYIHILDNKYLFKNMLKGLELPQPKLITITGENYGLRSVKEFEEIINDYKTNMAFKPPVGSGGRGIFFVHCKLGDYFKNGKKVSLKELWEREKLFKKQYLVEEKVKQHKSINYFNNASLNTFRVTTIKLKKDWSILYCRLRIGRSDMTIDNTGQGAITADLNEDGVIIKAFNWREKTFVNSHPDDTGIKIVGKKIENYTEIIELAILASKKFGFLGTIGWDIALSENGPLLLEGNPFWDCAYYQVLNGPILSTEMLKEMKKHNMFTLWDRTRIHPKMDRYRIKA